MRGIKAAACAAAILLLSGCGNAALPYAREMGDMALLRTMGVDAEGEGEVRVTVSTGKRAVGLQGGESATAGSLRPGEIPERRLPVYAGTE